jgi:hypothetical protein
MLWLCRIQQAESENEVERMIKFLLASLRGALGIFL